MELNPEQEDILRIIGFDEADVESGRPQIGQKFGDFLIQREIGSGGGGVVYEALQISLDRRIALKVIPLSSQELRGAQSDRVQREALMLARLKHANIVDIFDTGVEPGFRWVAMDFIDGHSLEEIIQGKAQGLPKPNAEGWQAFIVPLLQQTAQGLAAAHAAGMIHRDIKPANVLVDATGTPFLVDFGLARPESGSELTQTQGFCGTPRYTSPEQARLQAPTFASDVFSFGSMAFEALNGRLAFPGNTTKEILQAVQYADQKWDETANTPRDLMAVIDKCLEKDARDSYTDAGEVAADLQRFLQLEPVHAIPRGAVSRAWQRTLRRPRLALVRLCLATFFITAVVFATLAVLNDDSAKRAKAHGDYLTAAQDFHVLPSSEFEAKLKALLSAENIDPALYSLAADAYLLDQLYVESAAMYLQAIDHKQDAAFDRYGLAIAQALRDGDSVDLDFPGSPTSKSDSNIQLDNDPPARASLLQGMYAYAAKDYVGAQGALAEAAQLDPMCYPYLLTHAKMQRLSGMRREAVETLGLALSIVPYELEPNRALLSELRQLRRHQEAEVLAERILQLHPNSPLAVTEHAFSHLIRRDIPKAESLLGEALALAGDEPPPFVSAIWADLLETDGKAEEAKLVLEEALAIHPRDPLLNFRRAWMELREGKEQPALERAKLLQQEEMLDWRNEGLFIEASIHQSHGRLREALELFRKIALQDPQLASWAYDAGKLILNLEGEEAALDWINRSLQYAKDDVFLLLLRCQVLHALDQPQKALDDALRIMVLEPDGFVVAPYRAAMCWLKMDNPEAALVYAKKCVEQDPRWVHGWLALAETHKELGHTPDAIQALEHALSIQEIPAARALLEQLRD